MGVVWQSLYDINRLCPKQWQTSPEMPEKTVSSAQTSPGTQTKTHCSYAGRFGVEPGTDGYFADAVAIFIFIFKSRLLIPAALPR